MTLRELSEIMPDQHDHLTEIADEAHVAEVAEVLQVHPMLISCHLCLVARVLEKTAYVELLTDISNRSLCLQLKKDHETLYGIPPSL